MKIERLKELSDKLQKLLADPQPGLFTWHEAVGYIIKEIADASPFHVQKEIGK